jgi:hypothetical protein
MNVAGWHLGIGHTQPVGLKCARQRKPTGQPVPVEDHNQPRNHREAIMGRNVALAYKAGLIGGGTGVAGYCVRPGEVRCAKEEPRRG